MIRCFTLILLSIPPLLVAQTIRLRESGISANDSTLYGKSAMPYGEDYAFMVSAPKGWVLDNRSQLHGGLQLVLYPVGGSWKSSPAVMYINSYDKKVNGQETLPKVLSIDSTHFVQNAPDGKVTIEDSIETDDHNVAVVRYFKHSGQIDAVAYIDDAKAVEMLILSCRDMRNFKNSLRAFHLFVYSYMHMTKMPDHGH